MDVHRPGEVLPELCWKPGFDLDQKVLERRKLRGVEAALVQLEMEGCRLGIQGEMEKCQKGRYGKQWGGLLHGGEPYH